MNEWIIYKHTFPNGKCYIGKTSVPPYKRWRSGAGYKDQPIIYSAIQKYGWENIKHEILYTGLSAEEANEKEIECIEKYHSFVGDNPSMGYNGTRGGDGFSLISNEEIDIISSLWNQGYGIKQIQNKLNCGKTHVQNALDKANITPEIRQKRNDGKFKGYEVHQYDLQGNYIQSFLTATQAEKELKIPQTNISKCILGERHTAGNYQWSKEKFDKISPANIGPGHYKTVYQYDLNYNLVATYFSAAEASRQTGYTVSRIRTIAKKKEKAYGYIWSYEEIVK